MENQLLTADDTYKKLLHKINMLEVNHCYKITIENINNCVVVTFIHPNNIVVLGTDMNVPNFIIKLDFNNFHFRLGQPASKKGNTVDGVFCRATKSIYYSYINPRILVDYVAGYVNSGANINHERSLSLNYKLNHSAKTIQKRESSTIAFIVHNLLSDYIDTDTRKLACYYKAPSDYFFDLEFTFKHILKVEYNECNVNQFKTRLMQTLKLYPALFRTEFEIMPSYDFIYLIYNGISLKHLLGEYHSQLKTIKTPIVKRFSRVELKLISEQKIRNIDLDFYRFVSGIIHPDELRTNKDFLKFKKKFYKKFEIPEKSNKTNKMLKTICNDLQDSFNFLRFNFNIQGALTFNKLLLLNSRYHNIVDRLYIPTDEKSSDKDIHDIEQSRLLDISEFNLFIHCKQLLSQNDFIQEGKDLKHCVAGYHYLFLKKKNVIFSIDYDNHRSTLELRLSSNSKIKNFTMVQHRAYDNTKPNKNHSSLVINLVKFLNQDDKNFNQIMHSKNYRNGSEMIVNNELVIEQLLKPLKLYKKSNIYKKNKTKG